MYDINRVLKNTFEGIIFSITGAEYTVCFRDMEELAYTDGTVKTINNGNHQIFMNMSDDEKKLFKTGLFAHEMMHCIKTDFEYLMEFVNAHKLDTRFHHIHNILEDPAIENFAKDFFGQWLLDSVRFMNEIIYNESYTVESRESSYLQWEAACLQYGWCRSIKNEFSDTKAEKFFRDTFPLYTDILSEPDNKTRTALIYEFYCELIAIYPESELPKEENYHYGVSICDNSGTVSSETLAGIKRTEHLLNSGLPVGEIIGTNHKDMTGDDEPDFDTEQPSSDESDRNSKALSVLNDMLETTANKMEEEAQRKSKESKESAKPFLYKCEKYGTDNEIIMCNNVADVLAYKTIVNRYSFEIKALEKSLEKLLSREKNAKMHYKTGKFNAERYYTKGHQTVRFFDKRKSEKDSYDSSILLLIDESGSMNTKMNRCIEQVVILCETFSRLKIPFSVIGFSADEHEKDIPTHRIYVNWNDSEKYCVTKLAAHYENFDGYSIKYAGEILRKRESVNKLLVVISDGIPACNMYYHKINGITDTKQAISDVKKYSDVIGIAIGSFYKETLNNLHTMYGSNFLYSENISEIVKNLTPKLKAVLKEW